MANEYDPTDTQALERDQASRSAKKLTEQEQEDEDFRWLMSSRTGRRIVWKLLDTAGVNRLSFNQNAMVMAFNEGNRNYGNRVLAQIQALCPELYPTMLKEARK